jgi:hypothetical protein
MIRVMFAPGVDPEVIKLFTQSLGEIVAGQNGVTDAYIDPAESTPILEDVPEDLEVVVEQLNARILELEAELEEHKRSVDRVRESLRPLGTTAEPSVGFDTIFLPGAPTVDNGTTNPDPRR